MKINKSGFTLIEVVMVLLLMTILAIVAYEMVGDITSTKVFATARKLQSDIIFAQESAMSRRVHYRLQLTNLPNSYTVKWCNYQTTNCSIYPGNWTDVLDPSTNSAPFVVTLNSGAYSGVTWSATTLTGSYVEFNSAGVPLDGAPNPPSCVIAPCPLTVIKSITLNPGPRTVSVTPGTGRATIP